MTNYQNERRIAATRKDHPCCACDTVIASRSPATYYVRMTDGELTTAYFHVDECRDAEIDWNAEVGSWGEDWDSLSDILESDESDDWLAWLAEKHPIASARIAAKPQPGRDEV